jgi:hypothetical protein
LSALCFARFFNAGERKEALSRQNNVLGEGFQGPHLQILLSKHLLGIVGAPANFQINTSKNIRLGDDLQGTSPPTFYHKIVLQRWG